MIECPKCGLESAIEAAECPRCGVVFAKVERRAAMAGLGAEPRDLLAPSSTPKDPLSDIMRMGRAAVLVGLIVWTWQFARAPMGTVAMESILHLPNLVFHEAGHVILGFFGRFITVLGGSLFQFVVPLLLAVAFVRQRNPFAAAVCTWWAGENLLDVAPYIADARALQLILLGGKTGAEVEGHDWEYLLTQLHWLHLDRTLGLAAHRAGLVMMIGALFWGAMAIARNRAQITRPSGG